METLATTVTSGVFGIITTLGAIYLRDYLASRKQQAKLSLDFTDIEDAVQPYCEKLLSHFDADRVVYFEGHNGQHTLSGYSVKKLSAMAEACAAGVHSVKEDLQNLPSSVAKRTLRQLRECQGEYMVSHEALIADHEARMYLASGIVLVLLYKVHVKGRFVGFITVGFSEYREISEQEASWGVFQAAIVGEAIRELV